MEYQHQDLAQRIADYWASPDEANQKLGFVILKSQTRYWRAEKRKELINTAICLCWNKPELLGFLDFEKRKNAIIDNFDEVVNNAKLADKAKMLLASTMFLSDNPKVFYRVNIGFWGFEGFFFSGSRKKKQAVAEKITPELIKEAESSKDFSKIDAIIAEFKAHLPEFLAIENCSACITVYSSISSINNDHYFSDSDEDTTDLIYWRSPAKFAPRLTEYIFYNLNKFAR